MNSRKAAFFLILITLVLLALACGTGQPDEGYSLAELRATQTALARLSDAPAASDEPAVPTAPVPPVLPRPEDIRFPIEPPGFSPADPDRQALSGSPQTLDTPHFRVHYTLSGADAVPNADTNGNQHPDYVEEVARALEYAWEAQVNVFGWAAPPPDAGAGGDDRYDVYLANLMEDGTFGYTEGGYIDTIIGDNPNTPAIEINASSSFIALDNDYTEIVDYPELGVNAIQAMRTTATHEFNHAIQYGYDAKEPADWLWEATATWMQDELYDDINDGLDVIASVAKAPDTCQIAEGGRERVEDDLHWYGQWVFLRYLSERYGHAAVRSLWEHAATLDGYAIFDPALQAYDTDLNTLYQEFSIALLTRGFKEGATYPVVRLEGEASAGDTFYPVDGVAQMAADYIEIIGGGVLAVQLDAPELTGVLVGYRSGQASVLPLRGNQAVVDADQFDYLYLIVLNLGRARNERGCFFTYYTVTVDSGGQPQVFPQAFAAPYFAVPLVEGLLDPAAYFDDEDWYYGSNEEGWVEPTDAPAELLLGYIPEGYSFYEAYTADRYEFGDSEEEILYWVPGGGPATVLDYYGPGDYDILSVIASDSPYDDLDEYFIAIDYEPWENELVEIDGVLVLLEDWSDGDVYSNATFIYDGLFVVVTGTISAAEMEWVVEGLLW